MWKTVPVSLVWSKWIRSEPRVRRRRPAAALGRHWTRADPLTRRTSLSARRHEKRALGVVLAFGEELQGQVRVRGAALAEVQLDRVRLPALLGPARREIDGEAAEDALVRRAPLRLSSLRPRSRAHTRHSPGTRDPIGRLHRRAAGRGSKAARPSPWRRSHLDARAADLRADDALLDDAAVCEPLEELLGARIRISGHSSFRRSSTRARLAPRDRGRRGRRCRGRTRPRRASRRPTRCPGCRRELDHRSDDVSARTEALTAHRGGARPARQRARDSRSSSLAGRTSGRRHTWASRAGGQDRALSRVVV